MALRILYPKLESQLQKWVTVLWGIVTVLVRPIPLLDTVLTTEKRLTKYSQTKADPPGVEFT